jgi:hypothetical protein
MADRLFASSWHACWNDMVQRAVADVNRLDRGLFSDQRWAVRSKTSLRNTLSTWRI